MIGLNLLACEAIRCWLHIRRSDSEYLFPSSKGKRLNTSYLRRLCQRLKESAGFSKRIHPHCLRHSFATKASDKLSLRVLSQALGHESVATTDRYIAKLNPQEVINAMASV
jgi:site-specific recombinase XerD